MKYRVITVVLLVLALVNIADAQSLITVPSDYPTIQQAIVAASTGDTIIVNAGTYVENIDFLGKDILVRSDADSLPWTYDFLADSVTIDGGSAGPVVTFQNGESSSAILQGFTLINGFSSNGGGIYVSSSSPTISHNVIKENESTTEGGGIKTINSTPAIKNNIIQDNSSDIDGGGIYITNESGYQEIVIDQNMIIGNVATNSGGGVYLDDCHVTCKNNEIRLNNSFDGAGIYINQTIVDNIDMVNNLVVENDALNQAGGIYISNLFGSLVTITSCTVAYNTSPITTGRGIICADPSDPVIEYSIIWDEEEEDPLPPIIAGDGTFEVNWCDVKGWFSKDGNNFDAHPLFVTGDYYLEQGHDIPSENSPCVDYAVGLGIDPDTPYNTTNITGEVDEGDLDIGYHFKRIVMVPVHYSTIKEAIAGTRTVDSAIIMVEPGTYYENIIFNTKQSVTLRSTEGPENTIIDGGRIPTGVHPESWVSTINFMTRNSDVTVIDGFSIINGKGKPIGSTRVGGGGIFCSESSRPIIINNIIKDNHLSQSTNTIGGGIYINRGTGWPVIKNNIICNNTAQKGGGIGFDESANATVNGNIINNNEADQGGGMYLWAGIPEISNNIITNNMASGGAGIKCWHGSITLANNIIARNATYGGANTGGGVACDYTSLVVLNCTIYMNYGGGIFSADNLQRKIYIDNSIIWENYISGGLKSQIKLMPGQLGNVYVRYCDIMDGALGINDPGGRLNWVDGMIGIIDEDPGFIDPGNDDFHIEQTSPCIDAGKNDFVNLLYNDYEGDPRILSFAGGLLPLHKPTPFKVVDIGADEYCKISRKIKK